MYKQSVSLALLATVVFLAGHADVGHAANAKRAKLSAVPKGVGTMAHIDRRLQNSKGKVEVWVTLDQPSVAESQAAVLAASGIEAPRRALRSTVAPSLKTAGLNQRRAVRAQQSGAAQALASIGARELGRVQISHNAIAVRVDASQIKQIAMIPGVKKVRLVRNAELDLSETVPYVGAAAVQALGFDGTGVRVAVLDSGIDYTHRNLGGEGTAEAYAAAYGVDPSDPLNTTRDDLFPTDRVVEGIDLVGEDWPNSDLAPDPDPIDFGAHGTHVADIIGGASLDGLHKGVAPGVSLYAVKVCSAVSTSCSGVAMVQGLDYALDPNGDGDTSDAVDLVNMSIGSPYGQPEDVEGEAATNAVSMGVMVVASAGNSANRPYITGSPGSARGVLSVAQTEVPGAIAVPLVINAPASIAGTYGNTATVDWAPVGAGVTGDVAFVGRGCPADSIVPGSPADPFLTSPVGKVVLIDRGACSVSLKVDYAADAGATGVIIGLVAAGDAVSFSYGGGETFVPTMVIQQSLSNAIKGRLTAGDTVNVTLSESLAIPLIHGVAATSSRGPAFGTHWIKPEIGAPGASLSAEAGTGTGETVFGGTSGAAPMVTGAAALLMQAHPSRNVSQIKAMLMNSAETELYTNPALLPGQLAPISRVGAGELRVDRALGLTAVAWNRDTRSAALSFGAREVAAPMTLTRRLRIENFDKLAKTFSIDSSFRFANDEASGAVSISTPGSVTVGGKRVKEITVTMTIDPAKLPAWTLNGGTQGANGAALNGPEYDGYLTLNDGTQTLSVPWHVLPRKASSTALTARKQSGQDIMTLTNTGAAAGEVDFFSLLAKSPRQPNSDRPGPGDGFALIDLYQVGVRFVPASVAGLDILEFAVTTFDRRSHPNYPAEFDVYIDTTGDGEADFVVFNAELNGFNATGQNVTYVANLATGVATPYFYTDADLNARNVILTVPWAVLGATTSATLGIDVYAFDNYFTGNLTDAVEGMRFTPASPRYSIGEVPWGEVPAGVAVDVPLIKAKVARQLSSETGALFLYRRNTPSESQQIVRGQ